MAIAPTKNWKAWEDRQPGRGNPMLHVIGEVETTSSNQTPHLAEAVQGTNAKILILTLTIVTEGEGDGLMDFIEVPFAKTVTAGQYTSVDVHFNGASVAVCPVEIVS